MSLLLSLLASLVALAQDLAALAIAAHVAAWLHLLWVRRVGSRAHGASLEGEDLPSLVLQLPLYNEAAVVEELLRCVARLDWPGLLVQVLDDSTDETPQRVEALLPELRRGGLRIEHLRRGSREGFKAGALAYGLERCDADLIAILDADFRPDPDFLRRAVGAMDPEVGLLQCRWAFLNDRVSILTRAQAMHLDAHFAFEQVARSEGGLLMGFNGTAGVWRRACIEAAGGWEGDTLTEDLDLAYRAQLAGWRLRYVDAIAVPCELPEPLSAIRAQQHRWIRGGSQVASKLLGRLWRSELPLRRRVQGAAHLLASSVFLPVLVLAVTTPALPALLSFGPPWFALALAPAGLLLRGVPLALLLVYGVVVAWRSRSPLEASWRLLTDFPLFMLLVTGICAHTARAAWMGWFGPTGTFVRTPKGGQREARRALPETLLAEALLAAWCWAGFATALLWGHAVMAPFLAFQALAFTVMVGLSLAEQSAQRPVERRARPEQAR
ncbi:MAG: glycosyltransferase [Alphaproteobacteria bacterium]|nr:glycosyltransferase [Alphaproteobacteria bacterium]MCB9792744.1 glycosyltransferase [Alphaproteobacteria bacterium]